MPPPSPSLELLSPVHHTKMQLQDQSPPACSARPHNIVQLCRGATQSSHNDLQALGQQDVWSLILIPGCGEGEEAGSWSLSI